MLPSAKRSQSAQKTNVTKSDMVNPDNLLASIATKRSKSLEESLDKQIELDL